jgi:hypothetical protein
MLAPVTLAEAFELHLQRICSGQWKERCEYGQD